jgi:fucose 4-O-acetylase-like acetyltransferase
VLLVIIAFAYLWGEYVIRDKWSWVKQLGTTSLLVYWVHIEIVYGRWFGGFKNNLDNYQVVAFSVCLIAFMVALSVLRTKWPELRPLFGLPAAGTLTPRRVSGD